MGRMTKTRLDVLLVDRGHFTSREAARRAVLAGQVKIGDVIYDKPGATVAFDSVLQVKPSSPYVSRGADKLIRALDTFSIVVAGRTALDAGASTGGFTDVLLSRGAARVIAVDVGYGQLAWRLRSDPRVDVFERANIRGLSLDELPAVPDLVVADLSFISLTKVAANLLVLSAEGSDYVFLIKPQFEAGRGQVGKGGIIREAQRHVAILRDVVAALAESGLALVGLTYSPITGADGNIEFLAHLRREELKKVRSLTTKIDEKTLIDKIVNEAHEALNTKGK